MVARQKRNKELRSTRVCELVGEADESRNCNVYQREHTVHVCYGVEA